MDIGPDVNFVAQILLNIGPIRGTALFTMPNFDEKVQYCAKFRWKLGPLYNIFI